MPAERVAGTIAKGRGGLRAGERLGLLQVVPESHTDGLSHRAVLRFRASQDRLVQLLRKPHVDGLIANLRSCRHVAIVACPALLSGDARWRRDVSAV